MKTFKEFLSEGKDFDLEKFESDCAFALEQLEGQFLFHGSKSWPDDWDTRSWKPRSAPRNTPEAIHLAVNEFLEKKFHVPARNWMFASGDKSEAIVYSGNRGSVEVIYPIGKFQWLCCTDVRDLTGLWQRLVDKGFDLDDGKEELLSVLEHSNWKFNRDLIGCVESHCEIMFKCDRYYSFNYDGETFKHEIRVAAQQL